MNIEMMLVSMLMIYYHKLSKLLTHNLINKYLRDQLTSQNFLKEIILHYGRKKKMKLWLPFFFFLKKITRILKTKSETNSRVKQLR